MFKSSQEEAAWRIAERLGTFHWTDLSNEGVPYGMAPTYIKRWLKAERIEVDRLDGNQKWYRLAGTGPKAAPEKPARTPEDAMWAIMRRTAFFTPVDLVAMCDQVGFDVTEASARRYCRALTASGHLRCLEQAVPGRKQGKYRLINSTGRRAPSVRRVTGVLDPNTGMFCPMEPQS